MDPAITGTRRPKVGQTGQTGNRNKFLGTFVLLSLFFLDPPGPKPLFCIQPAMVELYIFRTLQCGGNQ